MNGKEEFKRDFQESAQDVKVPTGTNRGEITTKMENKKPWFNFMATNEWAVFMNIMRILTFIGIGILIYILIKEIEAVKLLGYDPCKICVSKIGCSCFCTGG